MAWYFHKVKTLEVIAFAVFKKEIHLCPEIMELVEKYIKLGVIKNFKNLKE